MELSSRAVYVWIVYSLECLEFTQKKRKKEKKRDWVMSTYIRKKRITVPHIFGAETPGIYHCNNILFVLGIFTHVLLFHALKYFQ